VGKVGKVGRGESVISHRCTQMHTDENISLKAEDEQAAGRRLQAWGLGEVKTVLSTDCADFADGRPGAASGNVGRWESGKETAIETLGSRGVRGARRGKRKP
jgi:hypothetical protein